MYIQKFISAHQHIIKKWLGKILKLVIVAMLFLVKNSLAQTVNFSFSPATVNVGDKIAFTNTSTGFAAGTHFVWNFGERCYLDTTNFGNNPFNADLCNDTVYCTCAQQHIFTQARPYTVNLKACTPTGVCFYYNSIVNIVTPALSIPLYRRLQCSRF